MFIGLLSICTVVSFVRSLHSNYKEPIKCISLKNRPCQTRPTLADVNSNKIFVINLLSVFICVVEVVTLLIICIIDNVY